MQLRESLMRLMTRFRYPVSLPEDISKDLGISLPSTLSFKVFLGLLAAPSSRATKLRKWMSRSEAEAAFQRALKRETFSSCSLFSYYFNQGWVVIALYFDANARLRRAYFQCPACESMHGFDILLEEESLLTQASVH